MHHCKFAEALPQHAAKPGGISISPNPQKLRCRWQAKTHRAAEQRFKLSKASKRRQDVLR